MILRSKHFIFPFLALTALASIYIADRLTVETTLIALGIISLTYLVFVISSSVKSGSKAVIKLNRSSSVLYKSPALYDIGDNPVKGILYLLEDKLVFQASKRKAAEVTIPLNEITDVSFSKTYNSLDRRIILTAKNGMLGFLVKGNLLWIEEIENTIRQFSLSCGS